MEEKRKLAPSLPANYISILDLKERWYERKRKEEEEERRRKEEVEEQLRIKEEEDLKKLEEQKKRRSSKKKESGDGGEVRDVKSVVIVSERDEVPRDDDGLVKKKKKNKGNSRKRYDSRKKRNHDLGENVVNECGESIVTEITTPVRDRSIALPVYVVKEDKTPVIRVYSEKKGEEAKGNGSCVMAIGTQFEDVVPRDEKKKKTRRNHRKKKSQDVVAVEDNVIERGMENNPVKDVVQVYREKKAKGNGTCEKAVTDNVPDIETQFEEEKKKKMSKHRKKKNQDAVAMEEGADERGTESKTPVKGVVRVYREKAKGDGPREKAVVDAMETRYENLSIKKEETKDLKEQTRSRKSKKKKIQNVVALVEDVAESGTIVKEKKAPVKGVIRVYREKVGQAKGNGSCEEAVTAIQTQFENLSVETKDLKAETRPSNRNRPKQRRDMHFQRVGAPMVWVKKGKNEGNGDGIGSGVKTLNA